MKKSQKIFVSLDTEPPLIDRCRSPPTVKASGRKVAVYWEEPQFSDNSGTYKLIYKRVGKVFHVC